MGQRGLAAGIIAYHISPSCWYFVRKHEGIFIMSVPLGLLYYTATSILLQQNFHVFKIFSSKILKFYISILFKYSFPKYLNNIQSTKLVSRFNIYIAYYLYLFSQLILIFFFQYSQNNIEWLFKFFLFKIFIIFHLRLL